MVPSERDLGALIRDDGTVRGKHGIGTVYADLRVIEATWRLIEEKPAWSIPGMNRLLVEQALHTERLDRVVAEGGARWQAHSAHVIGQQMGNRRSADLNLVDRSQPYWSTPFPDERRIPSRLGEGDRRVTFRAPPMSPFDHPVREVNLKAMWTAGVPDETSEASDVESLAQGFSFRYGPRAFVYDRYGVRPDDSRTSTRELREEDDDQT
jgi:CRISPR-associated endonuclease/helicase Cas3